MTASDGAAGRSAAAIALVVAGVVGPLLLVTQLGSLRLVRTTGAHALSTRAIGEFKGPSWGLLLAHCLPR